MSEQKTSQELAEELRSILVKMLAQDELDDTAKCPDEKQLADPDDDKGHVSIDVMFLWPSNVTDLVTVMASFLRKINEYHPEGIADIRVTLGDKEDKLECIRVCFTPVAAKTPTKQ